MSREDRSKAVLPDEEGDLPGMDPLTREFGWGDIKDHWQDCDECSGTGKEDPDGSGEPDDCSLCDGEGRRRWGSFYHADRGLCASCKRDDVAIAEMYEAGGDDGWTCLACYVDHHREACGCDLWAEAERARDALPVAS